MPNARLSFYTLLSLSLVLIVDAMVMGIVLPLMGALFINPHYAIVPHATSLLLRDVLYAITMGIFFLCTILGAPFLGDLSDSVGRRKVLLISLFGSGVCCLLAAMAISLKLVWLLIVARGIAGLMAGNQPLATAAIIDVSSPEDKARNIGYITLASCLGFAIGPLVGGIFSDNTLVKSFTYSTPFLIAGALAFINALGLLFTFRETFIPTQVKKLQFSKGLTLLLDGFKHRKMRKWVIVFFTGQLGWGVYFQSISLVLIQVNHYTTGQIGLFMTFIAILFAVGLSLIVPQALKRMQMVNLLLSGFALAIVALTLNFIFVQSILMHWLSVIPFVLGQACIYTTSMAFISNSVDRNSQGWAMGVAAAVGSLAWGIAALAVGSIISWDVRLPFILSTVLLMFCYILVRGYRGNLAIEDYA